VRDNLGHVKGLAHYNPSFEELKADRSAGRVLVFNGGSTQTMFDASFWQQKEVILNYRAWHDSMHIKYNLDFSLESELKLSFLLTQEAERELGWSKHSALLVGLDLRLHIMHWHLYKKHPERQQEMLEHALTHHDHSTLTKVW
jgi:hypothetical protein